MMMILGFETLTWLVVLCVLLLWCKPAWLWQCALMLSLLIGLYAGSLGFNALLSLGVLLVTLFFYQKAGWVSNAALAILIVIGVLFGTHVLPGFNNQEYLGAHRLNEHSAPFSIWFNYDKSLYGLLVLGLIFHPHLIRSWAELSSFIRGVIPILIVGLSAVFVIGLSFGYARVDWTPSRVFFPWALKNLFFTVIAEEVLFRGLIQRELQERIKSKHASLVAISIASFMFGIAHIAGGIEYVALSTLAGVVYGLAYRVTGRIEGAILAHFLLNAVHFLVFSYPYGV